MKYKCTDCGQEYDVKPEFCDCGNNLFEEISDNKSEEKFEDLKNIYQQAEFKPEFSKKRNVDVPSVLIFILCIILSILSWIFIGKDTQNFAQIALEEPVQTNIQEIPSIDKLWKEKTPSATTVKPEPASEPVAAKTVEKKIDNNQVKKVEASKKTTQTVTKPQQTAKTKSSQQTTSKPQQTVQSKPASQQPQPTMTEQEKQAIIEKLTTKNTPAPKTQTTQSKQEPQKTEVKQEIKPEGKAEVKAPDTAQFKKEFDAYKIALRNKLGKSINFAAVIGDGNCAVTFKLDQTGNLINRKFSVQSKNNSLNDAVYAAMMQNATFKEPPAGYGGETLTLTVKMYGGNFEVALK